MSLVHLGVGYIEERNRTEPGVLHQFVVAVGGWVIIFEKK